MVGVAKGGAAFKRTDPQCVPKGCTTDALNLPFQWDASSLRSSGGRLAMAAFFLFLRLFRRPFAAFVFYNCLDLDGSAVEPGIFYGLVHLVGYPLLHFEKGELPLQIDLAYFV